MDKDMKNKRKEKKEEVMEMDWKMRDWVGGQNQIPLSLLSCINPIDSNDLIFVNFVFEDCSFNWCIQRQLLLHFG